MQNIDYKETFAPTARMSSVRTLLQRMVQNNMTVHQMDVRTVYLNAPIDREIYIEQGFKKLGNNGVCKLNRSLYRLQQSSRNWNNLLHTFLVKEKFTQSLADPCLYVRSIDDERCVIVIIWVDDIIIAASDSDLRNSVEDSLSNRFKMTDLGELKWFLGTKFKHSRDGGNRKNAVFPRELVSVIPYYLQMSTMPPFNPACSLPCVPTSLPSPLLPASQTCVERKQTTI